VISDTEFFKLDKDGRLISGTYQEHGIGRLPCLLIHREEPEEKLLDSSSGEDLISAHLAVALLNTLMLKHQKSGTNLIAATGDISTTANDQPMDEECITNFGEGVSLQNLDLGANPSNYISAAKSVLTQVAANYGISESVFSLQYSATSGFEIELKRSALREVRNDQILDYRPVERELVEIQSRVLSMAGHGMKFDSSGFQVNFGETQAPRDPKAMLEYFEQARRMGLLSTQQMYMKMNPEASAQDAEDAIAVNAMVEARRVSLYRELNISPMASAEDPGLDPQQNGQLRIISSD
jgi:DhnA family fructose-bisphosphate aldolase class Ia